jgi:predicted alpha/beta hydrolase family esterase
LLGDGGIIVAHSIGGTVLVHTLADDPPKVKLAGIFLLAAPFVGEGGWPSDEVKSRPQLGSDLPAGVPIYLYHGRKDDEIPLAHAELYARAIPQAILRLLDDKDHQFGNALEDVAKDIMSLQ